MPGWLSTLWKHGSQLLAATQLPPAAPPKKVSNKQVASPSYLKTATPNPDTALPRVDRRLATTNPETYRGGSDTRVVMRDLIASNPDLAASVNAYIRTSITDGYTAVAKNPDGTFNRDGTSLLQQILTRFDILQNYDDGYSGINSMRSNSESLIKECMGYGAMALELVLDQTRLPRTLQPISVTQVQFFPDKSGRWLAPKQKISGELIDLDIPTFFYTALDQDLLETYATSPLEPAIHAVLFSTEFMNDLRRIVKKAVHPRMGVKIDEEKLRKFVPQEVLQDADKLRDYMNLMISDLEARINTLKPEDALVYFDMIGIEMINNGNISLSKEWDVLNNLVDSKLTTGSRALPSILGHGSGSQNVASSETLLFLKNAAGIQGKLNELYSRALTLAVRLFGLDVYVEFKYDPIDLRPATELEAFKAMKQSRVLELLSLGFLTDDDASIQLTGQLTPVGFTTLSGTGFFTPPTGGAANGNPTSNTSTTQGGGTSNQANQSKAPKQAKGPAKKGVA
jgi:hypothetical protein